MSKEFKPSAPGSGRRSRSRGPIILVVIGLAVFGIWGIVTRIEAASSLKAKTDEYAVPTVAVMSVPEGSVSEEVVLPGNVQAWHEAPIYARTSGYLKKWTADIGAHVKAGEVLAEIETPEVDAQLHQAEADLTTAQANNQLAQSTAKRWQNLLKTNSVSKQEADEKSGDAAAKAAAVASAQANLERLKQLEGFQEITAPFDGTITARNTDTGALINAGSGGTGAELFHIAETDKLRVYVQVPETYSAYITPAMKAELHFTEHADESFMGVLIRTADAIDPVTRTLLMELEVENASNRLLPGSYVEVHLKLAASGRSVHIPVNTLLFRAAGLQVAVVDTEGKARLRSITVGRDYGKEVEVASGLSAGETIIVNPPDSLLDGQTVKPVKQAPKSPSDQKPGGQPEDGKASAEKPAAGTQAADKPVPATPLPQEGKSDKGDHKP